MRSVPRVAEDGVVDYLLLLRIAFFFVHTSFSSSSEPVCPMGACGRDW